jgi:hypothetical protein
LVVQRPDIALATYESSEFAASNKDLLAQLRATLSFINPSRYRGVSRNPASSDELVESSRDSDEDTAAALIGAEGIVETLTRAHVLLSNVSDSSQYEVVYVEYGQFSDGHQTIGFDVGYWGGDHFSLVADTAITPRWHPPPPEAFGTLAKHLSVVNESVLFSSANDAMAFSVFYRSQDWAETEFEEGQFAIIRVALPNTAA